MQLLFPKPTTTMNEQIVVNGQLMHRYQFNPYLMPQQQQQHWTPHPQRTTVGKFRRRRSNHSLVATMDPAAVARRNERERNRVKQVNDGFDELKQRVPFLPDKKKLSKVEILRYAILYITDLKNILEEHDVSTTGKPRKDSEGNSCFSEEEDLLAADLLVFSSDQLSDSLLG